MRLKFFIIPALMFQVAVAQNGPAPLTNTQSAVATASVPLTTSEPASPAPLTAVSTANSTSASLSASGETAILDYQSVYEAATLEEELSMAAERFKLTAHQQEIWKEAAADRRATEKQAREKLAANAVTPDYNFSKDAVYRGLRTAHNNFHEAIIGYLNPAQKQALDFDRAVLAEKQKRIAKLPPPPPPAPTVTVAPVDSAAIKEAEKLKNPPKKSKKKKKPAGA